MNISQITSSLSAPVSAVQDLAGTADGGTRQINTAADRKKVAGQFEAILVRQMLSKSVSSMLGDEGNVSGTVYGDMMTDVLAQKLTAGQGLGLGRFIEKQLTPRGVSTDSKDGSNSGAAHSSGSVQVHP